jgi:glutathione S-transferase
MAETPKLKLYDAEGANTLAVRLFILERGGLDLDVETVDISTMANRRREYRTTVNARGEVPALRIGSEFVLTEITAICEYLDEVARGGTSLYGATAMERAETRMWLRRMDMEIAQPVIEWFRNDPATIDFYLGNRTPVPEARVSQKLVINRFLNLLDEELEGKQYLCGDRFSAADVHFYGLVKIMTGSVPWVLLPGRPNVVKYFERMDAREASQTAVKVFPCKVSV